MRLLSAFIKIALCIYTLCPTHGYATDSLSPEARAYLASLIKRGEEYNLSDKRTWHVLLHYRKNPFETEVSSDVDGAEFFFAKTGKTDPRAELTATLTAFFSTEKMGQEQQSPQCVFPARYTWLDSQLNFDPALMPVQHCKFIDLWRERINAESVSLVFASYYFNNPSSLFGHTLLRINSANKLKPNLLDYAISYGAVIDDAEGFFDLAWNGLTGGFEGRFSIYPYYDMVKQYNDLENRDLWEYQLNLSPEQIDFMLLHLWELINTHLDFYFIGENCSYHLLSLLEVANPEFYLTDQNWAWALPTETIKQVNEQNGLVEGVVRRPSMGARLENHLAKLSNQEKNYVNSLIKSPEVTNTTKFNQLAPDRLARVIDAAISFIQYESIDNKNRTDEQKHKMHALLVQRSQLIFESTGIQELASSNAVSPDQGHDPVRLEISGGNFRYDEDYKRIEDESFIELSIQPGFHDLLSHEGGQAPNSQINFLNLRARFETEREEWQLQNLTLVDIISLSPLSALIDDPSWMINVEWERNQDNGCPDCTPFILNPGIGVALQSNLHHREVYFSFLEANLQYDHEFDSGHRAGFGVTIGLLFDVTDQWRLALIANRTRFTTGQRSYVSEVELKQRYYLSRNTEVTFDLKTVKDYQEGKLGIAYYF